MTAHRRDITIILVLLVITLLCVQYFHKRMSDEQRVATVEPMSLIVPSPQAILAVNRPDVLTKMVFPMKNMWEIFQTHTPRIFPELIRHSHRLPAFLLAYYPQGTVFYIGLDQQSAQEVFKFFDQTFDYSALEKTDYGISIRYYPDIEKRFLGCYYHEGIFVASYNRKLIKETAKRQQSNLDEILPDLKRSMRSKGKNAAMNLYMPSEPLNLFVRTSDTTEWRIEDPWICMDLFYSEGKLCSLNELKYETRLDSMQLYQSLSDTITRRLNQLFPQIKTTTQVSHDEAVAYFTICGQ